MYIEGIHIVFAVDISCQDDYVYGDYIETIEETFDDIANKKSNLNSGEHLYLAIGELPELEDEMVESAGFPGVELEELDDDYKNYLLEVVYDLVPEQEIKILPKRKKVETGEKCESLDNFMYLCCSCMCESNLCGNAAGFKRFDKKSVDVNKCNLNPCTPKEYVETLFCPNCFNEIKKCECREWPMVAYLIDYNFCDIISILNKKGYFTYACCEGHKDNSNSYIAFNAKYSFDIPDGWYMDKDYCLRYKYGEKNDFEEEKQHVVKRLHEWASKLPMLEDAFE